MIQTSNNIEVILVNDGSTDFSGRICDEYQKQDLRVKTIHKSNEGVSVARNVGIERARGEYLTFIDSDDEVELDYVGYLYCLASENKCFLSTCSYRVKVREKNKSFGWRRL